MFYFHSNLYIHVYRLYKPNAAKRQDFHKIFQDKQKEPQLKFHSVIQPVDISNESQLLVFQLDPNFRTNVVTLYYFISQIPLMRQFQHHKHSQLFKRTLKIKINHLLNFSSHHLNECTCSQSKQGRHVMSVGMLLPLSSCDSSFMVGTWSHRRANNIVVCGPVYFRLYEECRRPNSSHGQCLVTH